MNGDLSGEFDALRTVENQRREAKEAERREAVHPKGWEPGVQWSGESGVLSTGPVSAAPSPGDWLDLLAVWDLDPEVYEVDPDYNPEFRAWDANLGDGVVQRFFYYKAKIRLRAKWYGLDVDELVRGLDKWRRPKGWRAANLVTDPVSVIVPASDWQIGKGDGDGVRGTMIRLMESAERLDDYLKELRRGGEIVEAVYLVGMGDLIENCRGHYASQQATVQLNRREQVRLTRRIFRDWVLRLAKSAPRLVVGAVGGNHGENRDGSGKQFMGPGDNDDVAVVEMVADVLDGRPELDHVSWVIPEDRLSLVLNCSGVNVGFTHGHLGGKGATAQAKQFAWWKDQMAGGQPVGDATVLVTGHYHHLSVTDHGPRVHIQCPAQDGGSDWWRNISGADSAAGQLVFVTGEHLKAGFDRLRLL